MMKYPVSRLLQLLYNCLTWIQEHIDDEEELKRVLTDHIEMRDDEFQDFGFDFNN